MTHGILSEAKDLEILRFAQKDGGSVIFYCHSDTSSALKNIVLSKAKDLGENPEF